MLWSESWDQSGELPNNARMTISRVVRFISRLLACSSVEYQFLYYVVRKVENKTKISNYGTSWFNPRGQKGLICTRDNITMARRGQNGWICTRESNDGGKKEEVIIKTDKVSDVGRLFNGVENGLKVLAKVKLIYYIDKGWVVEDCDL